jgi:16S rRNA (guanine527-N7)-methyltransferase
VPHEDLSRLGISFEPDQLARLTGFERLLREHAPRLGLIARDDLPRLYLRHILDSLRAVGSFRQSDREACDLGSGAGLPGIPLAIALPRSRFVLSEPRPRRAGFLELVVERLGLENAEVAPSRAEDLPEGSVDVCTARAFAPLERSWSVSWRLLRPGGRLVYFAGGSLRDPVATAEALSVAPGSVEVQRVLANEPPLVIMTRR